MLSLALRAYCLVDSGLNLDEMVALNAVKNLGFENLFFDNHPPMYLIFLKISCAIFGYNEFSARLPSVFFSAATTGAIGFMLLRQGIDKMWVFAGMFCHAMFPLSLEYAQQARPYAIFEFFSVIQFTLYLDFIKKPAESLLRKRLIIASFLTTLSSYLAALLFVFEWAFSFKKNKNIFAVVAINIFLIGLIVVSKEFVDWKYLDWQVTKYNLETLAFLPIDVVKVYSYYSALSGLGVLGILFIYLSTLDQEKIKSFFGPMLMAFSILFLFIGFSLVSRRAIFSPRYFIFLMPVYFNFLTHSCQQIVYFIKESLVKKILFYSCCLLLVLGMGLTLRDFYPQRQAKWREAADTISTYSNSVVLTTSYLALKTPYFDNKGISVLGVEDPAKILSQLEQLLQTYDNVWILDTYWNYIAYMPSQLSAIKTAALKINDFTEFEKGRETVAVVRISKK